MKRQRLFLKCLVLIAICNNSILNAQINSDCGKKFMKAFDEFRVEAGANYSLSYSMETTLATDVVSTETVKVRMNGVKAFLQTSMNKVYQDEEATVIIDDKTKRILITKLDNKSLNSVRWNQMLQLQDSLLNNEPKLSCQYQGASDQPAHTTVTLDDSNKLLSALGLKELRYKINEATERIEKVEAIYRPDHPQFKSLSVAFNEYNRDFKGEAFRGRALAKVYDGGGKVLDTYSEYSVINNLIN